MENLRVHCTILLAAGLFSSAALADDYEKQMSRMKELEKRCERSRAAKLAPIRESLVQECVKKDRRRSLQDCQGEYSTHGDSTTGVNGNVIKGLFYDLPECQEAERAWKEWEAAQPVRR